MSVIESLHTHTTTTTTTIRALTASLPIRSRTRSLRSSCSYTSSTHRTATCCKSVFPFLCSTRVAFDKRSHNTCACCSHHASSTPQWPSTLRWRSSRTAWRRCHAYSKCVAVSFIGAEIFARGTYASFVFDLCVRLAVGDAVETSLHSLQASAQVASRRAVGQLHSVRLRLYHAWNSRFVSDDDRTFGALLIFVRSSSTTRTTACSNRRTAHRSRNSACSRS